VFEKGQIGYNIMQNYMYRAMSTLWAQNLNDVLDGTIGMQYVDHLIVALRLTLLVCKSLATDQHEILFLSFSLVHV
jgi:hypothetical protein